MLRFMLAAACAVSLASAQQRGNEEAEDHPPLTTYSCASDGTCTPDTTTSITLDANWRWAHQVGSSTNCYTGDEWDTALCPDPVTCSQNCAIDGVDTGDYLKTYGITTAGDAMSIRLVTVGQYDTNIGARTFVMADDNNYKRWAVKNREFAFTADVSTLPCGVNGALYFVDMDTDGGLSKYPLNKAGAYMGTGYCDAQCPQDDKFINGEANIVGWAPDPNGDPNSGDGKFGTCCTEMDIWEANSISTAVTPHMCTVNGQYRCNGTDCGNGSGERFTGVCDKDGCDMNPWRGGVQTFYGPNFGPGGGCSIQANTNNMGVIMGTPSIQPDPVSCCAMCNATTGCAGFTWVSTTSNCFLKSSLGTPVADPSATSGTVSPPNANGAIDTTQPFTVVTQFLTADGTDSGNLTEIVRFFLQNGKKIPHPSATNIGVANMSTISDGFCKAKAAAYGDNDNFEAFGGLARMGEVMDGGMVLVLSQWVDYEAHMLWLDSAYPVDNSTSIPGVSRGSCATSSGDPASVIANNPDSTVKFSKISLGAIGFSEERMRKGLL